MILPMTRPNKNNIKWKYNRVLIIDDNDLDNFINQKILESSLFAKNIYINTSGTSALEFLRNMNTVGNELPDKVFPEVIFVDINMPLMDGFQFINNLLRMDIEALKHSKIVILTTSLNPSDRIKAQEISDEILFMNKPLTENVLDQI